MIEPPSSTRRPACLSTMKAPVRQTSTTRRNSSTASSVTSPRVLDPALLTTRSSLPSPSRVCSRKPYGLLVGHVDRWRGGQVGDVHGVPRGGERLGDGRADAGGAAEDGGHARGLLVTHVGLLFAMYLFRFPGYMARNRISSRVYSRPWCSAPRCSWARTTSSSSFSPVMAVPQGHVRRSDMATP